MPNDNNSTGYDPEDVFLDPTSPDLIAELRHADSMTYYTVDEDGAEITIVLSNTAINRRLNRIDPNKK